MEYIKTKTAGIFIKTDGVTATILNKPELQKEKDFLQAQLATLPALPDNATLLAWAKDNYPNYDATEISKTAIKAQIAVINGELDAIKAI